MHLSKKKKESFHSSDQGLELEGSEQAQCCNAGTQCKFISCGELLIEQPTSISARLLISP